MMEYNIDWSEEGIRKWVKETSIEDIKRIIAHEEAKLNRTASKPIKQQITAWKLDNYDEWLNNLISQIGIDIEFGEL